MFHREFRDHGSHHRARFITSLDSHLDYSEITTVIDVAAQSAGGADAAAALSGIAAMDAAGTASGVGEMGFSTPGRPTGGCPASGRTGLLAPGTCAPVSGTVKMPRAATAVSCCLKDCIPLAMARVLSVAEAFPEAPCSEATRSRISCAV